MLTFPKSREKAKEVIPDPGNDGHKSKHSKEAKKKKAKPKYVPGPIGSLIDQAETVGLQLTINQSNELEFKREGRGAIPLTKWGKKAWAKEIRQHINDDLLKELHDAVKVAYDDEGQELEPRRKDMVGFPALVDRHATMALLNNTIRRPRRRDPAEGEVRTVSAKAETNRTEPSGNVLQELDLELGKNPKHKATLHSIMAGSIRPNARSAHSHGVKPCCRCGADKEDVQHVFNQCPDHNQIRQKYDDAIQKVARQDGETQTQMLELLQNQALQNCGIMPECEKLTKWQDARNDDEQDAPEVTPLETLDDQLGFDPLGQHGRRTTRKILEPRWLRRCARR